MKKLLACICFVILSINGIKAQDSDIRQQIRDYKDPDYVLIGKARLLLYDKLKNGEIDEARKIKEYLLTELENDSQLALHYHEKVLIDYWVSDYDNALYLLKNIDSLGMVRIFTGYRRPYMQVQQYPVIDNLYANLCELGSQKYDALADNIEAADLAEIDKSILQLYLNKIIERYNDTVDYENITESELKINELSNKFLDEYPGSEYDNFVKKHIRSEYYLSNFGYGIELYGGFSAFTNNLGDSFTNPGIFGFAFDLYYKNFIAFTRLGFFFNKNRYDIPFSSKGEDYVWPAKSGATAFVPEIHLGYQVLNSKYIALAPFAGVGGTLISPNEDQDDYPEYKDFKNINAWTFGVGASVDFKLWRTKQKGLETGYGGFRLRYTYHIPQFDSPYNGRMHTITLGFSGLSRILRQRY